MTETADTFCRIIATREDMSNATAKFGAWLIGAALMTGGFPIELTTRQVRYGFERNGVKVAGFGGRYSTINEAVDWLSEAGYIAVAEGRALNGGFHARSFTITL